MKENIVELFIFLAYCWLMYTGTAVSTTADVETWQAGPAALSPQNFRN